MDESSTHLSEFLFGRLSTPQGRAEAVTARTTGRPCLLPLDPLDPTPGQPITVRVVAGVGLAVERMVLTWTADGSTPSSPQDESTGGNRVELTAGEPRWETISWGYVTEWAATLPGQAERTLVRFRIAARTRGGRWVDATGRSATSVVESTPVQTVHVDDDRVPTWLREAVVYHVFLDRFAPDPGAAFPARRDLGQVHGGTIRGLRSKLDDIADLGVTALWLSPLHPCPSYHGYDPTDLGAVEPRLGTLDDWHDLAKAARDRGLRLILDFVANHVSDRHPAFVAATKDRQGPYRDWFYFDEWPHRYRCFFAVRHMPILNTSHPAVRAHLIEQAALWLDRGAAGFRLDHAHGPGPGFWAEFRGALRARHPDCALIGEITDPPDELRTYSGRMDGCLDFVLAEALRGFFAADRLPAERLAALLERHFAYFGDRLCMPSFLDNHDMNRFLWVARGDRRRLRLAALCQFTLPDPPVVYYGTEVGLSQNAAVGRLEEARLPMPWDDRRDLALRGYYQALIRLRRSRPAGWPPPQVLLADTSRRLLAYRAGGSVVVLNNGDQAVTLDPRPFGAERVVFATDLGVGGAGGGLHLPPRTGVVLA
ncbi:MAG: alpha-amylase family glycosyl hydrolase [Gemmataceae bacterium]